MRGLEPWGLSAWVLLTMGIVALLVSGFATVIPEPSGSVAESQVAVTPTGLRYRADSLARVAMTRDVFRTDRRPALVGYDPARGATAIPEGPPKPQLILTGVVWGDDPEAIIEGLPTTDGPRVVRVGDTLAGLTVQRITHERVIVTGMDTTWTLAVKEPWQ